jgi:hypothetical protein
MTYFNRYFTHNPWVLLTKETSKYSNGVEVETLRRDQEQQFSLGFFASAHLAVLREQWKHLGYAPFSFSATLIPGGISLAYEMAVLSEKKDPNANRQPIPVSQKGSYDIKNIIKSVLNTAPKFIFLTSIISSFAMFYLNLVGEAFISLGSLAVLEAKKFGVLPLFVERYILSVFEVIGEIALLQMLPTPLVVIVGLPLAVDIYKKIIYLPLLQDIIPENLKKPILPAKHEMAVEKSVQAYEERPKDLIRLIQNRELFEVNFSSIYSKAINTLVSAKVPILTAEEKKTTKKYFLKVLDENISDGLEKLYSALDGGITDKTPLNAALFKKILSQHIRNVYNNGNADALQVQELEELGASCTQGLLRDYESNRAFNPQEDNFVWIVHHLLAAYREGLLDENITALQKNSIIHQLLTFVGGGNDIHFIDTVHNSLWHRLRTRRANRHLQVFGHKIIRNLLMPKMDNESRKSTSIFEKLFIFFTSIEDFFPTAFVPWKILLLKDDTEDDYQDITRMLNVLTNPLNFKKINPVALSPWLQDPFVDRLEKFDEKPNCDPDIQYHSIFKENKLFFLKNDPLTGFEVLTEEGIIFLLWSIGVIQPTDKALEDLESKQPKYLSDESDSKSNE